MGKNLLLIYAVDLMNFVLKGNLDAATVIALRATLSGTPFISYIILPALTPATQNAMFPFPRPIRVSAGLSEIGLCGNIRMKSFPPFMFLLIASCPAAICLDVIQAGSSA